MWPTFSASPHALRVRFPYEYESQAPKTAFSRSLVRASRLVPRSLRSCAQPSRRHRIAITSPLINQARRANERECSTGGVPPRSPHSPVSFLVATSRTRARELGAFALKSKARTRARSKESDGDAVGASVQR